MRLVAFCEAAADFRIARDLVDRVLREAGPGWVADVMDASPEGARTWQADGEGRSFFVIHQLTKYADALAVRVPHGHFDGHRGAADALMGRTALAIVRALAKRGDGIDAALVIRDLDDQPERKIGLEQARTEARSWAAFAIVLGCPDPMREAWVLCGFDPQGDEEASRLADLRRELGFAPNLEGHRLGAKDEQAKRSAKRVLHALTAADRTREERCWSEAHLEVLRARGGPTGLRGFLDEVEQHLVPLLAPR